jgi:hypothetical protein
LFQAVQGRAGPGWLSELVVPSWSVVEHYYRRHQWPTDDEKTRVRKAVRRYADLKLRTAKRESEKRSPAPWVKALEDVAREPQVPWTRGETSVGTVERTPDGRFGREEGQKRPWSPGIRGHGLNFDLSNPQVASTLDGLVGRKRTIDLGLAADLSKHSIRLPQGAIQAAVLEVLHGASGSLRVAEIHGRVEEELGRMVSRDTTARFLSVACRSDAAVVMHVEHGLYAVAR